jgi:exodeoxyribonuclease VII large subunit
MERRLAQARQVLQGHQRSLQRLLPRTRVDTHRQQVDDLMRRASRALAYSLSLRRSGLEALQARLVALSPQATLQRGYAIVRLAEGGDVVRSTGQVSAGDALTIRVHDGEFGATAQDGTTGAAERVSE